MLLQVGTLADQLEDLPWGSVYYETEKDDKGSDIDKRKTENNGKVVQVSAQCLICILSHNTLVHMHVLLQYQSGTSKPRRLTQPACF